MTTTVLSRALPVLATALGLGLAAPAQAADGWPARPVELVCSTGPGSGAAVWCQMMAEQMSHKGCLGTPVNVSFKAGGSNHEPALYTKNKPADGYTLLHASGSWPGYMNLPHFTVGIDDLRFVAQVEETLYAIGVNKDSPFKTFQDVIAYSKAHPGELAMGSNKVGSLHHQIHAGLNKAAGIDIRFTPYQGTGAVVKDVLGGHLPLGMAQPGNWLPHLQSGSVRMLLLLNDKRIDHPVFADTPTPAEAGIPFDFPRQWQAFLVKKGTADAVVQKIAACARTATQSTAYQEYVKNNPHVIPKFDDNADALAAQFRKDMKETREFMVENGVIKG